MTKLSNKEYKAARIDAENAPELYTFESYVNNGWYGYYNRYMKPDDLKEMRQEYRELKANNHAFALDDFGGRALVIPNGNDELVLQSYYTAVCSYDLNTGLFTKTWDGFSVTTLKHVNAFRRYLGLSTLSKREWIEL